MSTTDEFSAPASAVGIDWKDLNGALLLVEVQSVEEKIPTAYGDNDAVKADVTVLDGPKAGETYPQALIFPRVLRGQLSSQIGKKVLGRLGQGVAKSGQSAPWKLGEATEDDKTKARTYLSSKQFAAPASGQAPF